MAERPLTNMRVLRPSREKRQPGDVFVYQMPDDAYRFGRLIARSVAVGGFESVGVSYPGFAADLVALGVEA